MATRLKPVDAVLVGFGWTAAIIGQELTDAGLHVVALERGPFRDTVPDFSPTQIQDELRYAVRKATFEEPDRETLTFRNDASQTALPMRQLGSFLPGVGVGGAGVHWNGQNWRFMPTDFKMRSHCEQRYGKKFLPDDMTIQDWPLTYDDLEPYYDKWEYLCGISGKAGNLNGAIQDGGNPFEGPRKREFPLPPLKRSASTMKFDEAAKSIGLHPFPCPAGNASQPYTNPLGVKLGQCTYCGYCEWFGCANYSKASPQTTILPVLLRKDNFSYKTNATVTRVNLDSTGKKATGVTYVDAQGREFEQPAELVMLCAYSLHNAHLLLVSKIGKPYDPVSEHRRRRQELRVSDVGVRRRVLRRDRQSVHGRRRARTSRRRFQRRQLRSRPARFHRRRLHQHVADRRTSDPAALHADGTPKWGGGFKKALKENYLRSRRACRSTAA